jgi:hypothetical protein
MTILLWAFTAFNLFAGLAGFAQGVRLMGAQERARWRSKRLLMLAAFVSWSIAPAAIAATGTAWMRYGEGRHDAVPIILAPIAWLMVLGLVFAIVDFAEDGILGNARR